MGSSLAHELLHGFVFDYLDEAHHSERHYLMTLVMLTLMFSYSLFTRLPGEKRNVECVTRYVNHQMCIIEQFSEMTPTVTFRIKCVIYILY